MNSSVSRPGGCGLLTDTVVVQPTTAAANPHGSGQHLDSTFFRITHAYEELPSLDLTLYTKKQTHQAY